MRGGKGPRALVVCAGLVVLLAVTLAAVADEPPSFETLAAECYANGGNERLCRSLEQFGRTSAQLCRYPGVPDAPCGELDGRSIGPDHMTTYEGSWVHGALALQRRLDESRSLRLGLIPGTHNSFNSAVYYPTLSGMDHNQVYSLTDQLRMDMRGLELDVHWMPSPYGDLRDGGFAPILCHGLDETVSGGTHVHPGCTAERHLREGLEEIRAWLADHPDQFLLLYLENHLDNEAGHAAAARAIEQEIGDLVLKTPLLQPCAAMPADMSRADILATGARVLIVGNCDPAIAGAWGTWVHERDQTNNWRESLDLPGDYPGCATLHGNHGDDDYDTHFIRFYEDSTWLSAMASGSENPITPSDALGLVHCGVNLLGFDQLMPEDPRLEAIVWSWAENEPAAGGNCARQEGDRRFHAADCGASLPYACQKPDLAWAVTATSGVWSGGFAACAAEFAGSTFDVPATGYENELLGDARSTATALPVWLNYAAPGGSQWTPRLPSGTMP